MNQTLHELHLKFIIRNKETLEIQCAFVSADKANVVLNNAYNRINYEIKETY